MAQRANLMSQVMPIVSMIESSKQPPAADLSHRPWKLQESHRPWKQQESHRPWKQQRSASYEPSAEEHSFDASEAQPCMVYVGNLPYSVDWKELQEHMSQAGNVAFARILTEEGVTWGESLGSGCVRYDTVEEAQQALSLNGSVLKTREIQVDVWTGPASAGQKDDVAFKVDGDPATLLFVGNLSWSTKAWQVKEHMEQAGNVEFCQLLTEDGTAWGPSKGCACVRYVSDSDLDKALETLNDTLIGTRKITVDRWTQHDDNDTSQS